MSRLAPILLAALLSLPAYARLPAPSPEDAVRKQAAAEQKARDEDAAREALGRAQDGVAQRYRVKHSQAPKPVAIAATATAVKK